MGNQVFISYSHSDIDFVHALKAELEKIEPGKEDPEFFAWIDTQIEAGEDWKETIDAALNTSFAVVVVLSATSVESMYVTYEWSFAKGCGLAVIPILADTSLKNSDKRIHPRLEPSQWLDFTKRYKEPWDKLKERLRKEKEKDRSSGALDRTLELMKLARDDANEKNYDNAIDSYLIALKFSPTKLIDDIHYEMGKVYLLQGKSDLAKQSFEQTLGHNPQHIKALVQVGILSRKLASNASTPEKKETYLRAAEVKFREALELQDDFLDDEEESLWGSLGGVYRRLNDTQKAIDAYEKALSIKRTSYPLNNLGILYIEKGDYEKARKNFRLVKLAAQKKLLADPLDKWAYNDQLVALLILDNMHEAKDTFETVLEIGDEESLRSLVNTLSRLLDKSGSISEQVQKYIEEEILPACEQHPALQPA